MIKYIFFDIDGTLLPPKSNHILKSTKNAIKTLHENGIVPIICTGRNYGQALEYMKQSGIDSYITSNGQEINILGKNLYSKSIDNKEDVIEIVRKYNLHLGYENNDYIFIEENEKANLIKKQIDKEKLIKVKIDSSKLNDDIKQLWVFGSKKEIDEFEKNPIDNFKFLRWTSTSIQILLETESKGKAIRIFKKNNFKNIDTLYAFGDGINDLELFNEVNISVAMGNAKEELKKLANMETDDAYSDGIYNALKKLKLI